MCWCVVDAATLPKDGLQLIHVFGFDTVDAHGKSLAPVLQVSHASLPQLKYTNPVTADGIALHDDSTPTGDKVLMLGASGHVSTARSAGPCYKLWTFGAFELWVKTMTPKQAFAAECSAVAWMVPISDTPTMRWVFVQRTWNLPQVLCVAALACGLNTAVVLNIPVLVITADDLSSFVDADGMIELTRPALPDEIVSSNKRGHADTSKFRCDLATPSALSF